MWTPPSIAPARRGGEGKAALAGMNRARSAGTAVLLALCVGLGACGSGEPSSSTSTRSTVEMTRTEAAEAAKEAHPYTGQKALGSRPQEANAPSEEKVSAKLKEEAGKAAPFLVSRGDNSIPTYGSEESSSQKAKASKILEVYLKEREGENWGKVCSLLGATPRRQLEALGRASTGVRASCPKLYETFAGTGSVSELANPMVGGIVALRVKGEKAFALFYGSHRHQYMMPMALEGGGWKVNQVAPVAYPIGAPVGSR